MDMEKMKNESTPQWKQGDLDLQPRSFMDYTSEERIALNVAIREKEVAGITLDDEQQRFVAWSQSLGDDSQPYPNRKKY